jgi:hypothetical protein
VPSDSRKKITLSISILVALLVFYLLLIELIPPTSFVVPLFGKYLLFTLVLVNLSIVTTIITLNIHFRRQPTSHMPAWLKDLLVIYLPKLLFLQRPAMILRSDDKKQEPAFRDAHRPSASLWKDEHRRRRIEATMDHIACIARQIETVRQEKEVQSIFAS